MSKNMSFESEHEYIYNWKGEVKGVLNALLLAEHGISEQQVQKIKELHCVKSIIFDCMFDSDDKEELHILAEFMEQCEFALQQAWGFPQDRNMHNWWLVPKCTCPKMDNEDAYRTEYRCINTQCPVHGSLE